MMAVDLDGTLLRSDRRLDPADADALREAAAGGVKVILTTARPPRSTRGIYAELGLSTPAIHYNGAMVCDPAAGRVLGHTPLPAAVAAAIVAAARVMDPSILVHIEVTDTLHTDRLDPALSTETSRHFAPDHLGPLDAVLAGDVTKVMLLAEGARLEPVAAMLRARFGGQAAFAMSDGHLLQIMHPAVDKAAALAELAARWGIDPVRVLAIGDAPNDIGMLRWAGMGVAVGNAWPEVKAAARAVGPSNDAQGVAWAVRTFVLQS